MRRPNNNQFYSYYVSLLIPIDYLHYLWITLTIFWVLKSNFECILAASWKVMKVKTRHKSKKIWLLLVRFNKIEIVMYSQFSRLGTARGCDARFSLVELTKVQDLQVLYVHLKDPIVEKFSSCLCCHKASCSEPFILLLVWRHNC